MVLLLVLFVAPSLLLLVLMRGVKASSVTKGVSLVVELEIESTLLLLSLEDKDEVLLCEIDTA